mmetsp:Transcript_8606/g.19342  ORF Transcript_8606/g.19342 Transcript_8606/m.19342 type:complete len:283 (+) Transcript_8606:104-952(+)|eukprot:CAMPEP_0172312570 /NCGR_PEP_ID=MMETSP1058-20130122/17985_1 /TAXON_ID=83371 /ORGANISM="Detonula confervacea, Strain CCMP 353" /LENGTH=282 /DNA_ID=CAMNT_0013026071 /DNA_START=19 /DNA_END=867 /DNA_ORIENTATION=+
MIAKVSPVTTAFAPSTSQRCRLATRPRDWRRRISSNASTLDKHVRFMSIDDTITFDPSQAEAITLATSPPSGISSIPQFEPVLNTQAASSFVIIAIVFTLLQLRTNAVSNAAKRRSSALEALRKAESLQLSASDGGMNASDRPTEEQVTLAKAEYENALKEELDLRTIVPGVRIVAPNDPTSDKKERAAAKRFLGWESDDFGDDPGDDIDINSLGFEETSNRNVQNNEKGAGLSNIAKLILFGVASMLIVLLWTLSFDPMVADQIFTTAGGNPPSDMPLTSW